MKIDRPFMNLPVWQNLIQFVKLIYAVSGTFPAEEREGITRKLRNRITDIPIMLASGISNGISAGSGEYLRKASEGLMEVETLLYLCAQLGMIREAEFDSYAEELQKISQELHLLSVRVSKKYN